MVTLPRSFYQLYKDRIKAPLTEKEWRGLGIKQSRGWEHYGCHQAEPHILLFRRPIFTDPNAGLQNQELRQKFYQGAE